MNKYISLVFCLTLSGALNAHKPEDIKALFEQIDAGKKPLNAKGYDLSDVNFDLNDKLDKDVFENIDIRDANIAGCKFTRYSFKGALYNAGTIIDDETEFSTDISEMIDEAEKNKKKMDELKNKLNESLSVILSKVPKKEEKKS